MAWKVGPEMSRYLEKLTLPEAHVRVAHRKGRGKTIVFVHGLGASMESFTDAFEMLDSPLLAFDLPGFGESVPHGKFEYTMSNYAKFVERLIKVLGIEYVVIAGHSMGGAIGVHLVPMLGERCKGFANLEGNLTEMDCTGSAIIARNTFESWLKAGKNGYIDMLSSEAEKTNDDSLRAYIRMLEDAKPEALYHASVSLVEESKPKFYLDKYLKFRIPTIYIYGEKNKGRFEGEAALRKANKELCFINGGGHFMMNDNPMQFYNELDRFVKTV